jgi:FlaA1/EpsC-like NDP-sugar epimerase
MNPRSALVFLHDLVAVLVAGWFALQLRFNFQLPAEYVGDSLWLVLLSLPPYAAVFFGFGLYRGIWRFASLADLRRIVLAIGLASLVFTALLVLTRLSISVPRSVLVLHPILLLVFMGGNRLIYRAWKERQLYAHSVVGDPVLVLGIDVSTAALLQEPGLARHWRVVGVLDDNPKKHGRMVSGCRVLGGLDELPAMAAKYGVRHVILGMHQEKKDKRRAAIELATNAGLSVLTIPAYADILSGKVSVSKLRPLEVDDLLGRDPVELDGDRLHELITGRVILVTGAGGSIGSELCRQIARFQPGLLVLFEQNEYALYKVQQEFLFSCPELNIACIAGDVRDRLRVEQTFQRFRPHAVFHAAAYKHVPLMEQDNAWEAIRTNVLGTIRVAQAARMLGVDRFVLVSTDKAVNPTNVMGASKRLAEMVCQGFQNGSSTRFVTVRFGNVIGSTGSVVPLFREQIARGGPITVTHPGMTRYFMTIPEASQLVMQAASMGEGGEVFVLDMGEPIQIVELARDMIRLSGLTEEEIKIVFTGLRAGEKLFEEPLADDEESLPTAHPKLRIAKARSVSADFLAAVATWARQRRTIPDAEVRRDLRRFVTEYKPAQPVHLEPVSDAAGLGSVQA